MQGNSALLTLQGIRPTNSDVRSRKGIQISLSELPYHIVPIVAFRQSERGVTQFVSSKKKISCGSFTRIVRLHKKGCENLDRFLLDIKRKVGNPKADRSKPRLKNTDKLCHIPRCRVYVSESTILADRITDQLSFRLQESPY